MSHWLPACPDFRAALTSARGAPPSEAVERLARLAQHRLDYLQILQLDRALSLAAAAPGGAGALPSLRLALVGDATLDHLAPAIRVAALRRRLVVEVQVGRYGQHRQDLLDPASPVRQFRPDAVLVSLTARPLAADVGFACSADEAARALKGGLADLQELWSIIRDEVGAVVLQQTVLDTSPSLFGSFERMVPGAPSTLVAALNDRIAAAARPAGVRLVDMAAAGARDGLDAWHDTTRWLQAKMAIAPAAAERYAELVARVLAAQRGLSRKCLVLDLDNTLWGGVIGDDGLGGIVLGQGSPVGEAHLALQRYAKRLAERGVILAVCSKNDPAIAEAAFRDHPEMALAPSDIAAFVANWQDKAGNLVDIARRLNIGLDSLVFVDDNPVERARIREELPMVAVPELPGDVGGYVRCLADAGYFEAIAFTDDDRERSRQYAANASRDALQASAGNLDDFLRGLTMELEVGPFRQADLARVAQLINKTNQFNLTTRRCTDAEVAAWAGDGGVLTLQLRLRDRFGDNGLVSAMVLRSVPDDRAALAIETWVMSCRVFGRQLEFEAMNLAVESARGRGIERLVGTYLPTAKNAVVRDLYRTLGFRPAPMPGANTGGASRWELDVGSYVPHETHITRKVAWHE